MPSETIEFSSVQQAAAGEAPPHQLPIGYESQLGRNWCWAACAAMVTTNASKQCDLGRQIFPASPCPPVGDYDSPADLDDIQTVLTATGREPKLRSATPPLKIEEITVEIDAGRPVQIGWTSADQMRRHVILIVGYQQVEKDIVFLIHDPEEKNGMFVQISVADLASARGLGSWTHAWLLG